MDIIEIDEMMTELTINGTKIKTDFPKDYILLTFLRDRLRLTGAKKGCGIGQCGTCTVLVDGKPVRSCITPIQKVGGKSILTIEGLAEGDHLHPVQQAFMEHHAIQCGFCTPGMVLSAVALLGRNPNPSREEIKKALVGNLCRCTGYQQIFEAVEAAAERMTGIKDDRD